MGGFGERGVDSISTEGAAVLCDDQIIGEEVEILRDVGCYGVWYL
jgi:hypothetical protein